MAGCARHPDSSSLARAHQSSRRAARDPSVTTTAAVMSSPPRSKGHTSYFHYSFYKKVFTAQFKQVPSRKEARDLSAVTSAVFTKPSLQPYNGYFATPGFETSAIYGSNRFLAARRNDKCRLWKWGEKYYKV
jgi:hypothetical protein